MSNKECEQNLETEQNVEIDDELSPIILPPRLYEFFMANGKQGLEAMQVWIHLVYTARRQKTNQVWANNTYIRQGLHMGERKVKQVKAWLHKHGLIAYVQRQDPVTGLMGTTYIRVHACAQQNATAGAETARADNRTTGYNNEMLETNNEMLENNNKPAVDEFSKQPDSMKEKSSTDYVQSFIDSFNEGLSANNRLTRTTHAEEGIITINELAETGELADLAKFFRAEADREKKKTQGAYAAYHLTNNPEAIIDRYQSTHRREKIKIVETIDMTERFDSPPEEPPVPRGEPSQPYFDDVRNALQPERRELAGVQ